MAILGALALGTIALHRGEQINAMWLVIAALCAYALGYRFYSKFISAAAEHLLGRPDEGRLGLRGLAWADYVVCWRDQIAVFYSPRDFR